MCAGKPLHVWLLALDRFPAVGVTSQTQSSVISANAPSTSCRFHGSRKRSTNVSSYAPFRLLSISRKQSARYCASADKLGNGAGNGVGLLQQEKVSRTRQVDDLSLIHI